MRRRDILQAYFNRSFDELDRLREQFWDSAAELGITTSAEWEAYGIALDRDRQSAGLPRVLAGQLAKIEEYAELVDSMGQKLTVLWIEADVGSRVEIIHTAEITRAIYDNADDPS